MRENYDELKRKCPDKKAAASKVQLTDLKLEAAKQPVLTVAALNEIFKSDMDDWEMPRSKDTEEYD